MTKVVIIGAGYMAREHIKALKGVDADLPVGIMGQTKTKVDAVMRDFNIPICAESVKELYEKTKADAVIIAVNELASAGVVDDALNYPWVLLAEKPVSLEVSIAKKIELKRAKLNRQIYIAMNRRQYASTRRSATLLQDDESRRVIEVHDQENIIAAFDNNTPNAVISSWMVANSIHLIDYFNIFCRGRLVSVRINSELDTQNPFFTSSYIEYDSGDIGIYTALWNAPGPWSVKITTQHQMLEMRPLERLERQIFPHKQKQIVELPDYDKIHKPGLFIQISELIAATQGKKHSLPTLIDYIATHELVDRLYPSKIEVPNVNP